MRYDYINLHQPKWDILPRKLFRLWELLSFPFDTHIFNRNFTCDGISIGIPLIVVRKTWFPYAFAVNYAQLISALNERKENGNPFGPTVVIKQNYYNS